MTVDFYLQIEFTKKTANDLRTTVSLFSDGQENICLNVNVSFSVAKQNG